MQRFTKVLAGTCVVFAVVSLVVVGGALAGAGNSGNAKLCQKGGWASLNLQSGTGQALTFSSQADCVSFGANGGLLFNPSLIGEPSHVVEDQESFWIASGFHPNSPSEITVQNLGGSGGSATLFAVTTATGGLPAGVGNVFTAGSCAAGTTGAEITMVDADGVHASTTISLDCP